MIRLVSSLAIRQLKPFRIAASSLPLPAVPVPSSSRCFSTLLRLNNNGTAPVKIVGNTSPTTPHPSIARLVEGLCAPASPLLQHQPCRTVIKFSLRKGKRKTVRAVVKRFKRLHWGGWIRTKAGRHKKMWKKSAARKRRLRQHVFVNATQATLLDKMVTKYWKRPRYYIDDPYEPYNTREECWQTRRKPLRS